MRLIKSQEEFKEFLRLGGNLQEQLKGKPKKNGNGNRHYKKMFRRMAKGEIRR